MPAFPFDQLIHDSVQLPPDKRGELVAALLKSLEDDLPERQRRSPAEWNDEIARRSDELNQGQANTIDADESIALVKAKLDA